MKKSLGLFLLVTAFSLASCGEDGEAIASIRFLEDGFTLHPGQSQVLNPVSFLKNGAVASNSHYTFSSSDPTLFSFADPSVGKLDVSLNAKAGDSGEVYAEQGSYSAHLHISIRAGVYDITDFTISGAKENALTFSESYELSLATLPVAASPKWSHFAFSTLTRDFEPSIGILDFSVANDRAILTAVGTGSGYLRIASKEDENVRRDIAFTSSFKESALQSLYPQGLSQEEIGAIPSLTLVPTASTFSLSDLASFPNLSSLHLVANRHLAISGTPGPYDILVDGLAVYDAYEKNDDRALVAHLFPYSEEKTVIYYTIVKVSARNEYQASFYPDGNGTLPSVSEPGYVGLGWSESPSGTHLVSSVASLGARSKLYARFEANTYQLVVYSSSTVNEADRKVYSVKYGEPFPEIAEPEKGYALYQNALFSHYGDGEGKALSAYGALYNVVGDLTLYGVWYSELQVGLDLGYGRSSGPVSVKAYSTLASVLPAVDPMCPSEQYGQFSEWRAQGKTVTKESLVDGTTFDVSGSSSVQVSSYWTGLYTSVDAYVADQSSPYGHYDEIHLNLHKTDWTKFIVNVPDWCSIFSVESDFFASHAVIFTFSPRLKPLTFCLNDFVDWIPEAIPLDFSSLDPSLPITVLVNHSASLTGGAAAIKGHQLIIEGVGTAQLLVGANVNAIDCDQSVRVKSEANQNLRIDGNKGAVTLNCPTLEIEEGSQVTIHAPSGATGSDGARGENGADGAEGTANKGEPGKRGADGQKGGDATAGLVGGDALWVDHLLIDASAKLDLVGGDGGSGGQGGWGGRGGRGGNGGSGVPASWPGAGNNGGRGGDGGNGASAGNGADGASNGYSLLLKKSLTIGAGGVLTLTEGGAGIPGHGGVGGDGGKGGTGGLGTDGGFFGHNANGIQGIGGDGGPGGQGGDDGAYGEQRPAMILTASITLSFAASASICCVRRPGGRAGSSLGGSGGSGGERGSGSTKGSSGSEGLSGKGFLAEAAAVPAFTAYGDLPFYYQIVFSFAS